MRPRRISPSRDLSASLPDLKAYLALRESSPVFEGPKARGSLGIPCFVREDGTVTPGAGAGAQLSG
ncbi:MAG: hypothetical protein ACLT3D_08315 [Lawsonibacter sp.]